MQPRPYSPMLVTGASGFIGSALLPRLVADGRSDIRAVLRREGVARRLPAGVSAVVGGDIEYDFEWERFLTGCDVVVHAAARVHAMRDTSPNPLEAYRRINVAGTLRLAAQAANAGVRRFIYLSTVKVNGESTAPGTRFRPGDPPAPVDPYGFSKYEAEQGLRALAAQTSMEVTIIRPVLVYGPGVGANFRTMMQWLSKGIPLPLGRIENRRSLVAVDNLVDLIATCVDHPSAGAQTFFAADGDDLSSSELLRRLGLALGRPARLLPVPVALVRRAAALVGKQALAQRLCANLQVDISNASDLLGWRPPVAVDEGLKRAAHAFLQNRHHGS